MQALALTSKSSRKAVWGRKRSQLTTLWESSSSSKRRLAETTGSPWSCHKCSMRPLLRDNRQQASSPCTKLHKQLPTGTSQSTTSWSIALMPQSTPKFFKPAAQVPETSKAQPNSSRKIIIEAQTLCLISLSCTRPPMWVIKPMLICQWSILQTVQLSKKNHGRLSSRWRLVRMSATVWKGTRKSSWSPNSRRETNPMTMVRSNTALSRTSRNKSYQSNKISRKLHHTQEEQRAIQMPAVYKWMQSRKLLGERDTRERMHNLKETTPWWWCMRIKATSMMVPASIAWELSPTWRPLLTTELTTTSASTEVATRLC